MRTRLNLAFAALVLFLVSGCGSMVVPPQLTDVDTALRKQGVAPTVAGSDWTVNLPPQVLGDDLHELLLTKYAESYSRPEYLHYVTLRVQKDGWVFCRPVFRTDKNGRTHPDWRIAELKGAQALSWQDKWSRVHPMSAEKTDEWIRTILLPKIRDPQFKTWMKELD